MRLCCLGDLVLDVIVRLRQPLARGGDAKANIALTPGGQAANVAAWAATLGAETRWLGKRADDDAGRIATAYLRRLGVEIAGPVAETGNGIIVSLVDVDGERSMCPDRGVAIELSPADIAADAFAGCDWLHISGYALLTSPMREAAQQAAELARAGGSRVSVDLASWSGIRDVGVEGFRTLVTKLAPDVVFANEDEDRVVGGRFTDAIWILKRGAAGCSFDGEDHPAGPVREIVDTTGAGDALAAGWLVGGPELALAAAARCVGLPGSMPPPQAW